MIINNTILANEQAKEFDKAAGWRRKWLAYVRDHSGATSPAYAGELAVLGTNLLQQQKWTDAEPVLRECLDIRAKQHPEEWTTFNTQSLLGGALMGLKKYADAEPLLLKGYAGMKERADKIPPAVMVQRLTEALDRLVQLAEAQGKPDEGQEMANGAGGARAQVDRHRLTRFARDSSIRTYNP